MADEVFTLTELVLDRVDLVTAGANPGARVLIHKFDDPATITTEAVETPDVRAQEVTMSEQTPAETVAKAEFEAVQKQLADLAKALEDANAAKTQAAEEVAKMQHEKRQGEFIAKAKELGNLGAPDGLGALLLEVAEAVPEATFKSLEVLLKSANAQLEKGALFATFGKQDSDPEDFDAKVERMAKELLASGKAKTLPIAKLQVLNDNPGLRAEYRSNR